MSSEGIDDGTGRDKILKTIHDITVAKEEITNYHARMKLAASVNRLEEVLEDLESENKSWADLQEEAKEHLPDDYPDWDIDAPSFCPVCSSPEIDEHHTHFECVQCGWTCSLHADTEHTEANQ